MRIVLVLSMWFSEAILHIGGKQIRDIELEYYSIDSSPQLPKNLKFTAKR
jgi:hypothetical protein